MTSMLVRQPLETKPPALRAGGFGLASLFRSSRAQRHPACSSEENEGLSSWGGGWCLWSLFDDLGPGPATTLPSRRTIAGNLLHGFVLSEAVLGPKGADALKVECRKCEPEQDGCFYPVGAKNLIRIF